MPAAFECWNDQQYAQIDSQYPNLRLVQRGAVFCDQPPPDVLTYQLPSEVTWYRDIVVDAANPIIAFRCSDFCHSLGVGFNGSQYVHRFLTRGKQWVDYWAFATNPVAVGHGIEVYNQASQLVFTSKDRPAKLVGNWESPTLEVWQQAQVNFGGVRQLAVINNSATFGLFSYPFGGQRYADFWGYAARIVGAGELTTYFRRCYTTNTRYSGNNMYPTNNNYTLLDTAGQ